MAWVLLFFAGLCEIGWALALRYSEGLTRPLPLVLMLFAIVGSVTMFGLALRAIPLGTAYAVWTGIGTAGTALVGIVLFGEPALASRLFFIGLIIAGIGGLKLVGP